MLEGGGTDRKKEKKSTAKKPIKNESIHDGPSILKFLKIVEAPRGRKPAGTSHLPGDVLAVGSQQKDSQEKDDYHQSYDPNWNPALGFPNYKIARTFFFGGMKK